MVGVVGLLGAFALTNVALASDAVTAPVTHPGLHMAGIRVSVRVWPTKYVPTSSAMVRIVG